MAIREIRQEGPYCYTYSPFHAPNATEVSVIANRGDGQFGAVSVARTSVATTSAKSAGSACAWPLVAVGA